MTWRGMISRHDLEMDTNMVLASISGFRYRRRVTNKDRSCRHDFPCSACSVFLRWIFWPVTSSFGIGIDNIRSLPSTILGTRDAMRKPRPDSLALDMPPSEVLARPSVLSQSGLARVQAKSNIVCERSTSKLCSAASTCANARVGILALTLATSRPPLVAEDRSKLTVIH